MGMYSPLYGLGGYYGLAMYGAIIMSLIMSFFYLLPLIEALVAYQ